MPLIRLLHASDLHFSTRPGTTSALDYLSAGMYLDAIRARAAVSSHSTDVFYSLAEFLYEDYHDNFMGQMSAPVDAVLLTGDIATTGLFRDLTLAFRALDNPPMPSDPLRWARDKPTLAGSTGPGKIPLWLLPGNHDRLKADPAIWYASGGIMFDDVFQSYWGPLDPATFQGPRVKEYGDISRSGLTVKVFAADFTLRHGNDRSGRLFYNQYAQGKVYDDVLQELIHKTQSAIASAADPAVVIWAVHFPPGFPGIARSMQLIDDRKLLNAARGCEVSAILAGHTHEPVWYRSPGASCDVFCSGTTTQEHAPSGNHFHILNIETNALDEIVITPESYIFDPTIWEFVAA